MIHFPWWCHISCYALYQAWFHLLTWCRVRMVWGSHQYYLYIISSMLQYFLFIVHAHLFIILKTFFKLFTSIFLISTVFTLHNGTSMVNGWDSKLTLLWHKLHDPSFKHSARNAHKIFMLSILLHTCSWIQIKHKTYRHSNYTFMEVDYAWCI